jgi:hypothetical protein
MGPHQLKSDVLSFNINKESTAHRIAGGKFTQWPPTINLSATVCLAYTHFNIFICHEYLCERYKEQRLYLVAIGYLRSSMALACYNLMKGLTKPTIF